MLKVGDSSGSLAGIISSVLAETGVQQQQMQARGVMLWLDLVI
jgi:hypothetical protein